jgi:hypothetical protein
VIFDRDGMYVMLEQADAPKHVVSHWTVSDKLWNIYFWISDLDALHASSSGRAPGSTTGCAIGRTAAASSASRTWMVTTSGFGQPTR